MVAGGNLVGSMFAMFIRIVEDVVQKQKEFQKQQSMMVV
jgi:hypothetical protein